MRVSEARAILGVGPQDDRVAVRSAYRHLLLQTHPDVSGRADAAARTMRLTAAYTTLIDPPDEVVDAPSGGARPAPTEPGSTSSEAPRSTRADQAPSQDRVDPEPILVALDDAQTIAVGAPANETLMLIIDAAHRLGEITYLDPSAGLVEVVVEFIEAPTSSILMTLQGRATGVTEVFVTVEPLSGGDAPPSDAVTRLLLRTLVDGAG
jgi:DnaJ domain